MAPRVKQAVVLVGGKGTRLLPLTLTRPKPAMPILDRPFIKYLIGSLASAGVREVIMACGYKSDLLAAAVGDGSDMGVELTYSDEESPMGTGGALKLLEDRLDPVFAAANGDTLTSVDILAMEDAHFSSGAAATVSLSKVSDPSRYGVVRTDADGRIAEFQDKPRPGEEISDLVNTGVYIAQRRVLGYVPPRTFFDFSKDLFPLLLSHGERLTGYVSPGPWTDIGVPADLIRMNLEMAGRVHPAPGWESRVSGSKISGRFYIGDDAFLRRSEVCESVISKGCTINDSYISGTLLMKGCRADGAHIERSVIGEGCTLGRGCVVTDAVLGDGTVVGENEKVTGRSE
ncbi:NDP-sugar synthase [Methanomassiliicoccales archaeon LGM-DZ1]|nr:NDP-sugar synthase [Methanomassiliicoccales archaeon LGM-DZ1]